MFRIFLKSEVKGRESLKPLLHAMKHILKQINSKVRIPYFSKEIQRHWETESLTGSKRQICKWKHERTFEPFLPKCYVDKWSKKSLRSVLQFWCPIPDILNYFIKNIIKLPLDTYTVSIVAKLSWSCSKLSLFTDRPAILIEVNSHSNNSNKCCALDPF